MTTSKLGETFYCTKPVDFSKPLNKDYLKDKSVIVTGGANGLGLGCVNAFAEAGAYVTIFDINEEKASTAAKGLSGKGHHVQFIKTDTTSWSEQVAGFKAAVSFSPSKTIDIVLANAGITGKDPLEAWLDTELSSGDDPQPPSTLALDINLKGVYYTTRLSLFYFKKTVPAGDVAATSKHLIYVSSIAGYIGLNNTIEYNASKFGVRGLFKSIRHSTAILGGGAKFRANLIAPTFIKTDLTASIEPALKKRGFEMGTVQDVVAGVMRVACDEDICARAIAIAAGKHVAGDRNFDLCDDWEGFDGGKEMLENIRDSTLPHLETLAVEYSMRK